MSRPRWWNALRRLAWCQRDGHTYGVFHDGYTYRMPQIPRSLFSEVFAAADRPGHELSRLFRGIEGEFSIRVARVPDGVTEELVWNESEKRYEQRIVG